MSLPRQKAGTLLLSRRKLSSRRRLHLLCAPTRKGCLCGREGGRSCAPESGESSPPAPSPGSQLSAPERAEPEKPASDGTGLMLAKNCPLHLNFPGGFSRTRSSPGATSDLQRSPFGASSFLPRSLSAQGRKTHRQEGARGAGAPTQRCPAVPSQPILAPGLSITGMSVI